VFSLTVTLDFPFYVYALGDDQIVILSRPKLMEISYEKFLSIYVKASIFYLPELLFKVIHTEIKAQSSIFPGEAQFSEQIIVKHKL